MELFRRLCLVTALLSAGVSDSFIMASSSSSSSISGPGAAAAATEGGDDTREIPLLPEADPNSNIPRLKLGETIRFEAMGPIILNLDGTYRNCRNLVLVCVLFGNCMFQTTTSVFSSRQARRDESTIGIN